MSDLIEHYIPHDLVEGPEHGDPEKGGTLWDLKIDANGLEGQLNWLRQRCQRHLLPQQQYHAKAFSSQAPQVIWIDHSSEIENAADVLFTSHHALAKIRLDHFREDCEALLAKNHKLTQWEYGEKAWCTELVEKEYNHVMKYYDPTIVTLKKPGKIVIADGVFDDS